MNKNHTYSFRQLGKRYIFWVSRRILVISLCTMRCKRLKIAVFYLITKTPLRLDSPFHSLHFWAVSSIIGKICLINMTLGRDSLNINWKLPEVASGPNNNPFYINLIWRANLLLQTKRKIQGSGPASKVRFPISTNQLFPYSC